MLIIQNPYCDKTLEIEIDGDFTVFFAGWHAHYFASCENEYETMKKEIAGILNGNIGALSVIRDDNTWICDDLCKIKLFPITDELQLLRKYVHSDDVIEELLKIGGSIHVTYWNPTETITFKFSGEENLRKFPRRSTVRFVIQKGKAIGSGAYKKYDDATAFFTYMYVKPSSKYDTKTVYDELYQVLEKDVLADGYKKIFVICEKSKRYFYEEKGYTIGRNLKSDKLIELMGAKVTFDFVMEKYINQ